MAGRPPAKRSRSLSVIPRALARTDIEEAVEHYAQEAGQDVALGFIDALEAAFIFLSRNPSAGSLRFAHELDLPGLRVWPLKKFPHLVFYLDQGDRIDVWRVLHARRDVPDWLRETTDDTR